MPPAALPASASARASVPRSRRHTGRSGRQPGRLVGLEGCAINDVLQKLGLEGAPAGPLPGVHPDNAGIVIVDGVARMVNCSLVGGGEGPQ